MLHGGKKDDYVFLWSLRLNISPSVAEMRIKGLYVAPEKTGSAKEMLNVILSDYKMALNNLEKNRDEDEFKILVLVQALVWIEQDQEDVHAKNELLPRTTN